jgi:hypothetical protein
MFNRSARTLALAGATIIAALLAVSCKTHNQNAGQAKPEAKKVSLGPDEPTNAIPPDLFKDMPMYPGLKVLHVRRPKGSMREILMQSDASFDQLVAFYKEQLSKGDYHITSSLIMRARRTWSCDFHKRGRPASVMLYPSDNDKSKLTVDLIYELPSKVDEAMLEPIEKFDVVGPGEVGQQAPNPNEKKEKTKRN